MLSDCNSVFKPPRMGVKRASYIPKARRCQFTTLSMPYGSIPPVTYPLEREIGNEDLGI